MDSDATTKEDGGTPTLRDTILQSNSYVQLLTTCP